MQKKTVARILTEIKANYRYTYRDITNEELRLMNERWYDCLKAFSDEQVETAFRVALCKLSVPPTIADIIGIISRKERLSEPTDSELWTVLKNSIAESRRSVWTGDTCGYMRLYELKGDEALRLYRQLPETIRSYIDFDGFCAMGDMTEEQLRFERSRFLKSLPEIREAFRERRLAQTRVPNGSVLTGITKTLIGDGGN